MVIKKVQSSRLHSRNSTSAYSAAFRSGGYGGQAKLKAEDQNKEIQELKIQIQDLENKWKRAMADYQNLEKRVAKERLELGQFLNAGLIDKLLGVLDDLERAELHLKDKGLTMTVSQFRQVLKTEGVEEIKAQGENFNPELMDCIEVVSGPKNIAMNVTLKGYKLNNQVLRPAKVKVGKGGHAKIS